LPKAPLYCIIAISEKRFGIRTMIRRLRKEVVSSMLKKRSLPKMVWEIAKSYLYSLIICSIVMFSTTFLLEYTLGKIFIQGANLFISAGILYATFWFEGDREKNFVQFGRMEEDMMWGLKAGLVGMLIPMATIIMLIVAMIIDLPDLVVYYKLINPQINLLINVFIPTIAPSEISVLDLILTALLYLYVPIACFVGYQLGYRRISISEKMIYVDKNKKKDAPKKGRR